MKLFRKPCTNEDRVQDTVVKTHHKFRLDDEQKYMAEQNQYEYVRREHGYDYMPPSQYVPSRSMSEEVDYGFRGDDPRMKIEQPESDLSESVHGQRGTNMYGTNNYDPYEVRRRNNLSRHGQREDPRQMTPNPHHRPSNPRPSGSRHNLARATDSVGGYGSGRDAREYYVPPEEATTRPRGNGRRDRGRDFPGYREVLEEQQPRHYQRSSPMNHREQEMAAVEPPSPRRRSEHTRHQSAPRRREPEPAPDMRRSRSRDYRRSNEYQDMDRDAYARHQTPNGRSPRVPTAFGYQSDDSAEDTYDEQSRHSRYKIDQVEVDDRYQSWEYEPEPQEKNRFSSGRRENRQSDPYPRPTRKGSDLNQFTTSTLPTRKSFSGDQGREYRSEGYELRRRTPSHMERRDDVEREHASYDPYVMETKRRSMSSDFATERRRQKDSYYGSNESVEMDLHPRGGRQTQRSTPVEETQAVPEKKKGRGIFGRLRDSVRGDKGAKKEALQEENRSNVSDEIRENPSNRPWNQQLREKGSLFESSPESFLSEDEMSPSFQFDAPSAKVPYPYEDESYTAERPIRGRSSPSQPYTPRTEVDPPRARPRKDSGYQAPRIPPQPDDFWYKEPEEMRRSRSSNSKPFQSTSRSTPPLRANPDYRQLSTPRKNGSPFFGGQPPQHQQQVKSGGLIIPNRSAPPVTTQGQLHFNPANVNGAHKKGFIGCY
eukprot:Nitzschia sp. Nitz4//scaffold189_size62959//4696//6825//NITZ4_006300-RA/size62959-processed-gene-0.15-mRNA-1//1//CDS//3329539872//2936//frame0